MRYFDLRVPPSSLTADALAFYLVTKEFFASSRSHLRPGGARVINVGHLPSHEFPGGPDLIHWSVPDPACEGRSDAETYPAFERMADERATGISFLLELIDRTPPIGSASR
jgi:hypothetical protein